MDEDYEGQRAVAFHEAGHAVAAMRSGGRIKEIDIGNRSEDDEHGFTFASYHKADKAFYIYAGPWVEARFHQPTESVDLGRAHYFLRANEDDWTSFQRTVGHNVSDIAWTAMQFALLEGDPTPPECRVDSVWHHKAGSVLAGAWDDGEIQELTEQLLAHNQDIRLRNGQLLTRENTRDRWQGSDFQDVFDDGDGIVGPPPLIVQSVGSGFREGHCD